MGVTAESIAEVSGLRCASRSICPPQEIRKLTIESLRASARICCVADTLTAFERIARSAHQFTEREADPPTAHHSFAVRNLHPSLPPKVRKLFDDGHYAEATFEAFKYLDKLVSRHSGIKDSGYKLMMAALDGDQPGKPRIQLTPLNEVSEVDEQNGFPICVRRERLGDSQPPVGMSTASTMTSIRASTTWASFRC